MLIGYILGVCGWSVGFILGYWVGQMLDVSHYLSLRLFSPFWIADDRQPISSFFIITIFFSLTPAGGRIWF